MRYFTEREFSGIFFFGGGGNFASSKREFPVALVSTLQASATSLPFPKTFIRSHHTRLFCRRIVLSFIVHVDIIDNTSTGLLHRCTPTRRLKCASVEDYGLTKAPDTRSRNRIQKLAP